MQAVQSSRLPVNPTSNRVKESEPTTKVFHKQYSLQSTITVVASPKFDFSLSLVESSGFRFVGKFRTNYTYMIGRLDSGGRR